jgi:hypothetical protein
MVDAAIAAPARTVDTATEDRSFRHVIWRLVPLLVLLYLVVYIDPQNVSYAKLQMLSGARAAAGIAAITCLGNLGGFFGQNVMPWVQRITGSTAASMPVPAACRFVLGIGAILVSRMQSRVSQALATGT